MSTNLKCSFPGPTEPGVRLPAGRQLAAPTSAPATTISSLEQSSPIKVSQFGPVNNHLVGRERWYHRCFRPLRTHHRSAVFKPVRHPTGWGSLSPDERVRKAHPFGTVSIINVLSTVDTFPSHHQHLYSPPALEDSLNWCRWSPANPGQVAHLMAGLR